MEDSRGKQAEAGKCKSRVACTREGEHENGTVAADRQKQQAYGNRQKECIQADQ